jgi:hypothetical protein
MVKVLTILFMVLIASPCYAAWGVAVIRTEGGMPVIAQAKTPYTNWVSLGDLPNKYGLYMVSDTPARLQAADTISGVYGICVITKSGDVQWAELDNVITPAMRTKINTWLSAHSYSTIPVSWTNRRVVTELLKRIDAKFEINQFFVDELK